MKGLGNSTYEHNTTFCCRYLIILDACKSPFDIFEQDMELKTDPADSFRSRQVCLLCHTSPPSGATLLSLRGGLLVLTDDLLSNFPTTGARHTNIKPSQRDQNLFKVYLACWQQHHKNRKSNLCTFLACSKHWP